MHSSRDVVVGAGFGEGCIVVGRARSGGGGVCINGRKWGRQVYFHTNNSNYTILFQIYS